MRRAAGGAGAYQSPVPGRGVGGVARAAEDDEEDDDDDDEGAASAAASAPPQAAARASSRREGVAEAGSVPTKSASKERPPAEASERARERVG